jgi:ADP-dependent NAD(P)H-hydrate dehydratase / NAD(P)H-hydrate epimerase
MSAIFETMDISNFRRDAANSIAEPVYSAAQVRAIEARYPNVDLMRRAGRAAAEFLFERTRPDARIVLLAGPGNNGGDALACAAELAAAGYAPQVVMLADPDRYGDDAKRAWQRVFELQRDQRKITVVRQTPKLSGTDWIIDGLFGIGLKRPLDRAYSDVIRAITQARIASSSGRGVGAKVLALDVPSGINADTGSLVGESAVPADHTLTFIAHKPGLLTGDALDYVGVLHLASLGLETPAFKPVGDEVPALATAVDRAWASAAMLPRTATSHKGTHGTLAIIGGASGMLGAALLAARAGMRMGAGKVKVGWLAEAFPPVDIAMPELMMMSANTLLAVDVSAVVVGCGLSVSGEAARTVNAALRRDGPLVLDADALNLIAESADLVSLMRKRTAPTIITPHPTEAARLLGCATADVQRDRLRAASDLAKGYCCIAVLKGAGTIISDGENISINRTGNALLATAGTGDVLAGMIGALLAQGYPAWDAARIGVALHGAAADALAARGVKRAVASDIVAELATL